MSITFIVFFFWIFQSKLLNGENLVCVAIHIKSVDADTKYCNISDNSGDSFIFVHNSRSF